ncbi:MAG: DUF1963 domain-containing protein [Clostridiales bacterium]|nr:DUF1963 domain-containing protein [Clostridiales bacterium]
MGKSIRLKISKADENHDFGTSKFLGYPVIPEEWENDFDESELFLLQLNLEEIKDLDKDNLLPHKGYLYFFLDVSEGVYNLKPIVRYYDGEPVNVIDDFNSVVEGFEEFVEPYVVTFEECDEKEGGTKLFGVISDQYYADEDRQLLLQFDPYDSDMGLFPTFDGMLFFFFDKKDPMNFDKVGFMEDFS